MPKVAAKKEVHIHQLKLHTFKNGTKAFFCIDNCDYRIVRELALGKLTICFRCGRPFQLNQYSMTLVKPHCEECHVRKGQHPSRIKPELIVSAVSAVPTSISQNTAEGIVNDMKSRMSVEIKSPVQMLTEDELI